MKKILHNILTKLMAVLFVLSISAMDSDALWIPVLCMLVSGTYLAVYAYKKGWLFGSIEDGEAE